MPIIMLVDNGSVRAEATIQLRKLAQSLGEQSGHTVHPVSLQHADKIPAEKIDNRPAEIFGPFISAQLEKGERNFIVLPLFFGASKAVSSFIPDQISQLQAQHGDFSVKVADVVYPLPHGDRLLVDILHDHINITAKQFQLSLENIILVDHGSPAPQVTDVRKHLATQLEQSFAPAQAVNQAVMERREGVQYDFNGDLLENVLTQKASDGESSALVILLFFLPGRHAGEQGDIVDICESVMTKFPQFKIAISPLVSEHPDLINLLNKRLKELL